jgi:pimeloyl-ACP methyl ester carboxylesterase
VVAPSVGLDPTTEGRAIETPTTRSFTAARIAALALIAILAGGLAYLRIGPDSGGTPVPAGAKAGDLSLDRCDYTTENGTYRADCGTLVVPENRADPASRLIALPVIRIHARAARAAEPVFRLVGGPGLTNMKFAAASRFADDHDVVLVGYRGVDGSSRLDCPEVESALKESTDFLSDQSFDAYAGAFRACARRLSREGVDLAGYSLAQRVDDLEAARVGLGYGRIDLLSESAGTRTAMVYSWRYPLSIHRSVMIGVNPPGHFLWDPQTTDAQLRYYADLCSQDDSCRRRTADLAASMRRTASQLPDRWLFLPIKPGNVRLATFFGLINSSPAAAPVSGPMTLDTWLSAAEGDPSGFWFMSLAADLIFPTSFVWGEFAAIGRADAQVATDYFATDARPGEEILGNAGTDFTWGGGKLVDAWPAAPDEAEYSRVRESDVDTLLIGGTLDFTAPPQVAAKELLPYLPNGHQVVLAEFGHTTDFWTSQPQAGSRLINTFLDRGQVDDSLYQHAAVDFTPPLTQTAIAKGVAATMVGLALLMVLSLVVMARRVRRRGGFGRRAGVTLRSLYPLVLGLGGWCLGALIVLTALPGVPLDDELITAASIGLPIGLGTYFAWVNRDWSATTRSTGLAAAAAGALIGAWLGFNATEGIAAVITTLIGAAVGANLILLALDIAWDRQNRRRLATVAADVVPV